MATKTDVAVIGGGAVGLCTARALQNRGRQVTVIEKGDLGSGCSTGNAGLVVPSHVIPLAAPGVISQGLRWLLRRDSPFRVKPRLDLGFLDWLWRFYSACTEEHVEQSIPVLRDLSLKSRALYEEWASSDEEGEETDFGFDPSGLLMLHQTEKGRMEDFEEAERAMEAGLEVSILDREGVEALTPHLPSSVTGGVYYHQDAFLNPGRLIDALAQELEQEKSTVLRRDVSVTGFERTNGSVDSLQTTDGTIEAKEIVVAAGAWSASLGTELGLAVPIEPAKGYSITFQVPNGRPGVPFILNEDKVSVTPMKTRVRFAGTLELAGFDSSVDPHRLKPILEVAAEYVPALDPTAAKTVNPWVGFRPCTPDGLPVVGRVPNYDNVVLATGHCMLGISLAPITGQLVGEIINGESPALDPTPLRLDRFH